MPSRSGEVGYGLEVALNDATSKRIISEVIVPRFKQQDFSGGIVAGVDQIIRVVDGEPLPAPQHGQERGVSDVQQFSPMVIILALGLGSILRAWMGRLPGAVVTGGVVAGVTWFMAGALSLAMAAGVMALFFTLAGMGLLAAMGMGGGGHRGSGGGGRFRGRRRRFWRRWRVREMVMNKFSRIVSHMTTTRGQVSRAFSAKSMKAIEQAIKAAEVGHAGEIRFVVEGALDGLPLVKGQSARERAIEVFSLLRIWDTEHNSGVLIDLLMADRRVEIVADRGIHARVGTGGWEALCREMEASHRGNAASWRRCPEQSRGHLKIMLDLPTVGGWKVGPFTHQLELLMITFEVKDMTCGHCVSTITKAVRAVDKAATVQIDLPSHRIQIEPTETNADELRDAIVEAGYTPVAAANGSVKPDAAKRSGCCCG